MTRLSATRHPTHSESSPPWLYAALGFIIGAAITAGGFITFTPHANTPQEQVSAPNKAVISVTESSPIPITFYERLKEDFDFDQTSGPIHDVKQLIETPAKSPAINTPTQKAAPKNNIHGNFLIQVASLASSVDAESLRVKLIMLGLDKAHTRKAHLNDGKIRYRVLVGPLTESRHVAEVRQTLELNKYDSLILKLKK